MTILEFCTANKIPKSTARARFYSARSKGEVVESFALFFMSVKIN